jgi:hypothetical protein
MSRARDFANLAGAADAGTISGDNLVINGDMAVWQRGTTIDTIANGGYLCDRWRIAHAGLDGNVDVDRSTDVPSGQGFRYSQKISMDASETSLDAADQLNLQQRFEGQDLQHIMKGTSSAKSLTLSFWVKSSVASTYSVNLRDNDNTRIIGGTYVVNTADTWEKKTITFAGDTSGTLDNDNARSLDLTFYMDAGSDRTDGTFATSWAAQSDDERVYATTGWLESTSPEFYITGVKLEVGSTATPFQHESYAENLEKCQRYYYRIQAGSNYQRYMHTQSVSTTNAQGTLTLPTEMRTEPTIDTTGTAGNYAIYRNNAVSVCTSLPTVSSAGSNNQSLNLSAVTSAVLTAGESGDLVANNNTSVFMGFNAEL